MKLNRLLVMVGFCVGVFGTTGYMVGMDTTEEELEDRRTEALDSITMFCGNEEIAQALLNALTNPFAEDALAEYNRILSQEYEVGSARYVSDFALHAYLERIQGRDDAQQRISELRDAVIKTRDAARKEREGKEEKEKKESSSSNKQA